MPSLSHEALIELFRSRPALVGELAVLSAVVHGQSDNADAIARAAFEAVRHLDGDQLVIYTDVVIASLRASARVILEALMMKGTYEFQSDFAKRYVALGRAEGEAQGRAEGEAHGMALALLGVLESRGVVVPADARTRIEACTDAATLKAWIGRAVTAASADDLFAE